MLGREKRDVVEEEEPKVTLIVRCKFTAISFHLVHGIKREDIKRVFLKKHSNKKSTFTESERTYTKKNERTEEQLAFLPSLPKKKKQRREHASRRVERGGECGWRENARA